MEHLVQQTAAILLSGGIILYPTDTIWGIGCNASNAQAIDRLYNVKQRDRHKSMLILCTEKIIDTALLPHPSDPRPTTFILPHSIWHKALKTDISSNLPAEDGSLGIRIVKHPFCSQLIESIDSPLVSTSANLSGQPSPSHYSDIELCLKERIDFCVPPLPIFESQQTQGSRIVKLLPDGSLQTIRP